MLNLFHLGECSNLPTRLSTLAVDHYHLSELTSMFLQHYDPLELRFAYSYHLYSKVAHLPQPTYFNLSVDERDDPQ